MTWQEFNDLVRVHLVAHNRRQGIQTLIDNLIKVAVWDLQAAIPGLSREVRRTLRSENFRTVGYLGVATLPVQQIVLSAMTVNPDDPDEQYAYDFSKTEAEINAIERGLVESTGKWASYNPVTGSFTAAPNPRLDGSSVRVLMMGKRLDFDPSDDVVFDEKVAEAVADYVLTTLSRTVDGDPQAAMMYENAYTRKKRLLFSEWNAMRARQP